MQPQLLRTRLRPLVCATLAAASVGAFAVALAPSATAAPAATGLVASGSDWTVTSGAGGYVVAETLPVPLPVRDDVPEIVVDGVDLGPATESADGTTLSITTTDPAVAKADSVTWQWSSGGDSTATGSTTLPATKKVQTRVRAATPAAGDPSDPTTIGTDPYTVSDYNFGAQAIPLSDIGGIRGELEGRIYLPSTSGEHPLVIFLHGRHSACYNTTTLKGVSGWPCPTGTTPILSYAGYDGAGDALAADGYTVVSISANAINANDNQLAPDDGAVARGQLVLDTLTMLKNVNAGTPVSYHDAATDQDVDMNQALINGEQTLPTATTLTAAGLVGTMDFSDIGVMGHSRGGEGAVTAATLNEGLAHPWAIKSVFALAPIDFTRPTLPGVITTTLLPYCDGDVSDQQGEHFYADSRTVLGDNVLRSNFLVMGTDHDFYNTSWTPPYPGASDDWGNSNDPVCGTSASAVASGQNIRLSVAQQYQVGSAYVAGFFELTLGGATQFQGMFDGTDALPPSVAGYADIRTVAQQPSSSREDITDFSRTSPLIGTNSLATATVCASKYGRTVPVAVPSCTSPTVALSSQSQPYWTPASFAPNVPLNQMTHLTWAAPTTAGTPPVTTNGALTVTLPAAQRDVSKYSELAVTMSPDENVVTSTDMMLSVTDTSGHTWSAPVSTLNKWGVTRMPGSALVTKDSTGKTITPGYLDKIYLQQVKVPTATIAASGVDLTSIGRITFTAGVGADGTGTGGVYLSDVAFDTPALGTPDVHTYPTVNVAATTAEESSGPGTDQVAVYLSQAATTPVTTWLSMIGSTTGKVGLALQKLTFEPGQTCQDVTVPTTGDTVAGTTVSTAYKFGVSDSIGAVLGSSDFANLTIREDDGLTTGTPAPAVGVQGDPCAEFAALSTPGTLTTSSSTPAPGASVAFTGSGYRNGESVGFSLGTTSLGSAIALADGTVSFTATIPADAALGAATVSAVGAGSGFTETVPVTVLTATTTTLALNPAAPAIDKAVTLTATVTGAGTDGGVVTFADAGTTLGTATVSGGTATLQLPAGFKAGDHSLTASFAGTDTTSSSESAAVMLTLVKSLSAIALATVSPTYSYGATVSGVVSVAGASGGSVSLQSALGTQTVPVSSTGTARFTIKGGLSAGAHLLAATYLGTDTVAPSAKAETTVDITKEKTTTTLGLSATKVAHGKTETISLSVGGRISALYPDGTVTVTVSLAGRTTTYKVALHQASLAHGSLKVTLPTKGTATISATYGGDADYASSKAAAKKVTVS